MTSLTWLMPIDSFWNIGWNFITKYLYWKHDTLTALIDMTLGQTTFGFNNKYWMISENQQIQSVNCISSKYIKTAVFDWKDRPHANFTFVNLYDGMWYIIKNDIFCCTAFCYSYIWFVAVLSLLCIAKSVKRLIKSWMFRTFAIFLNMMIEIHLIDVMCKPHNCTHIVLLWCASWI